MQTFPSSPSGFKEIIKRSFINWWPSLKLTWPLILGLVLIREFYCPSCAVVSGESWSWQIAKMFLVVLLDISIWIAISVMIYRAFQLQIEGFWHNILPVFKRCLSLLISLFLYSLFISLAGLVGYIAGAFILQHAAPESVWVKVIPLLIGLPMLYVIVLLLFTLPILIIDNLSIWEAFKRSAAISSVHWFRAFFAYVGIVAFLSLLRGIYMWQMSANITGLMSIGIDLLSFLVLVPLFINYYVLALHDLKLRDRLG